MNKSKMDVGQIGTRLSPWKELENRAPLTDEERAERGLAPRRRQPKHTLYGDRGEVIEMVEEPKTGFVLVAMDENLPVKMLIGEDGVTEIENGTYREIVFPGQNVPEAFEASSMETVKMQLGDNYRAPEVPVHTPNLEEMALKNALEAIQADNPKVKRLGSEKAFDNLVLTTDPSNRMKLTDGKGPQWVLKPFAKREDPNIKPSELKAARIADRRSIGNKPMSMLPEALAQEMREFAKSPDSLQNQTWFKNQGNPTNKAAVKPDGVKQDARLAPQPRFFRLKQYPWCEANAVPVY